MTSSFNIFANVLTNISNNPCLFLDLQHAITVYSQEWRLTSKHEYKNMDRLTFVDQSYEKCVRLHDTMYLMRVFYVVLCITHLFCNSKMS